MLALKHKWRERGAAEAGRDANRYARVDEAPHAAMPLPGARLNRSGHAGRRRIELAIKQGLGRDFAFAIVRR